MFEPYSNLPYLETVSREFLDRIKLMNPKPIQEMTSSEARQFLLEIQRQSHSPIGAKVDDIEIFTKLAGTVSLRLVRPLNYNESLPVNLYFHGGGWVMGDKETHDMLIRQLAVCTNSVVVFVNYSRSPEAIYPMALNQAYGTLLYLYENASEFNMYSDRIILTGDSAGGNLATATALKSIKEGGPKIQYQALLYPVTDANMDSPSYEKFKDGPWLTKRAMEYFFNAYLPDKSLKNEIYVSPLRAELNDLSGMPSTLIITAENDVLRDEGEAYARKLDLAGVDVICARINSVYHDFMMLNDLQMSKSVKGAFSLLCNVLKTKLHN